MLALVMAMFKVLWKGLLRLAIPFLASAEANGTMLSSMTSSLWNKALFLTISLEKSRVP